MELDTSYNDDSGRGLPLGDTLTAKPGFEVADFAERHGRSLRGKDAYKFWAISVILSRLKS